MEPKLDADQQKAVEHFEGPALVVAGPGSGKTTVIKERILHLIREHNVDPEQILAIAFTNAAVEEIKERIRSEQVLNHKQPEICTLHVFGKDIMQENYKLAGFKREPDNIWNDKDIEQTINKEKTWFNRANDKRSVYIYTFEGQRTGRCYIGQTIDMKRREREHRTHSSNRGLREALQKGDEQFDFTYERVKGSDADDKEADKIKFYKNRAAVHLDQGTEQFESEITDVPVTIYKIRHLTTVKCYFGQSTDPERSKARHFSDSPNDSLRKAIEDVREASGDEGVNEQFKFEIIIREVPRTKASTRIKREMENHKNWAVFNREDPSHARDSNRRRIEMFCQYFDVPYDEVFEHTQKFKIRMEEFGRMEKDIEKEKRQVTAGLFEPDTITDPVLRAFAKRYEKRKKKADAIDFLDMLILSADMLEKNHELLREYREKYRYVFVDEFQDISPVDFRLIDLFSENLFAVGDDDQAIYGFCGGDSQIMQKDFGNRENVKKYEITRNYRSTSTIVRHAKTLIEHNPDRIPKNLRANNSARSQVEVLPTPRGRIKNALLRELSKLLMNDFKKVAILARNWRGEINKIQQEHLDCSELRKQGFEIDWEELSDELDEKYKRKMILRRGTKEIEVINIHTAKGREWDKVILLVNTIYDGLPDKRNNLIDERRLFYVAVTRAKQELVVLDGGNCQFISEFQKVPQIETVEAELEAEKTKQKKALEEASEAARKQYKPELNRLPRAATEAENAAQQAAKQLQTGPPKDLKVENEAILKELIPILDSFESVVESANQNVETANVPDDFAAFTESVRHAQTQLLDLLKHHELKPIEASLGEIFNPAYHEEISAAIYSDEVPPNRVAREKQRGYLLQDIVIRKAQVVVSKGQNIRTPERLNQIVETYLDRLIAFKYGPKYALDKPTIRRKMTEYLAALDKKSLKKINAGTTIDAGQSSTEQPLGNYCVGQHTMHMCTDVVFRNFWKRMWAVVEQSRKMPEPQIKPPSVPAPSKIKITPEPLQEVDDTPSPMLQNADEILKTHIQELKPEPPETEIVSEPLEAVNNNTQLTSQEYEDILSKHIGELKTSSEPTQLLTDETSHDMESEKGASVDQTDARYLDSLEGTDDSLLHIEGKDLSEDEAQDVKKGFGYYLRQFGRFVTRKLKQE